MIQELSPVVFIDGEYNKNVSVVSQYGFIDLRAAMATGVVPSELSDNPMPDNGISDPNAIIGRPDDVFSAKRASEAYKSSNAGAASSSVSSSGEDTDA